uniref:Uncharacterized protein n=1 Tax=Picea glauca TaxID=3330 RepID=A0A101M448_PICGL|nr:hypothetical protein ABT39_MTgene608 [Picea glauca]
MHKGCSLPLYHFHLLEFPMVDILFGIKPKNRELIRMGQQTGMTSAAGGFRTNPSSPSFFR